MDNTALYTSKKDYHIIYINCNRLLFIIFNIVSFQQKRLDCKYYEYIYILRKHFFEKLNPTKLNYNIIL